MGDSITQVQVGELASNVHTQQSHNVACIFNTRNGIAIPTGQNVLNVRSGGAIQQINAAGLQLHHSNGVICDEADGNGLNGRNQVMGMVCLQGDMVARNPLGDLVHTASAFAAVEEVSFLTLLNILVVNLFTEDVDKDAHDEQEVAVLTGHGDVQRIVINTGNVFKVDVTETGIGAETSDTESQVSRGDRITIVEVSTLTDMEGNTHMVVVPSHGVAGAVLVDLHIDAAVNIAGSQHGSAAEVKDTRRGNI